MEFTNEFLKRNGLKSLIDIINNLGGNTLAYALTSMQNLMEHDHGWEDLGFDFINMVGDQKCSLFFFPSPIIFIRFLFFL